MDAVSLICLLGPLNESLLRSYATSLVVPSEARSVFVVCAKQCALNGLRCTIYLQANLEDVLRAMAMPAADFGDNLDNFLKRNGPEESKIMPNDLAFNHVTDVRPFQILHYNL